MLVQMQSALDNIWEQFNTDKPVGLLLVTLTLLPGIIHGRLQSL